jgi:hypothetical protein
MLIVQTEVCRCQFVNEETSGNYPFEKDLPIYALSHMELTMIHNLSYSNRDPENDRAQFLS